MRIQNPQVEKRSPLREHRGLRASFSPSGYVPSSQTLVISQRLTPWKAHGNLAVEGSKSALRLSYIDRVSHGGRGATEDFSLPRSTCSSWPGGSPLVTMSSRSEWIVSGSNALPRSTCSSWPGGSASTNPFFFPGRVSSACTTWCAFEERAVWCCAKECIERLWLERLLP